MRISLPYNSPNRLSRFLLILFLVMVGMVGAQPIDREMFAKVVGMNSKRNCPMYVDGVTIDKLTYTPGYLHFHISATESDLAGLSVSELKAFCADRLRYRKEHTYFNYLYSHLGNINGGFCYDIKLVGTDSNFTIRYNPQEVRLIWADRTKPAYKDASKWMARNTIRREIFHDNQFFAKSNSEYVPYPFEVIMDSFSIKQDTLFMHYHTATDSTFLELSSRQEDLRPNMENNLLLNTDWLKGIANAGFDLRVQFFNASGTRHFTTDFPLAQLQKMLRRSKRMQEATNEQMDAYLRYLATEGMQQEILEIVEADNNFQKIETSYQDGVIQIVFYTKENTMNFNMTPEEAGIIKKGFISHLKATIENDYDTPDVMDTFFVTKERLYERLKGFQILYIEENTRKTTELFVTSEEIQNGKLLFDLNENAAEEWFREQLQSETFAKDIRQMNQEMLPMKSGELTMEQLLYDGENLHFFGSIDTINQTITFQEDPEIKQYLATQILFSRNLTELYDRLAELGGGLVYHFRTTEHDSLIEIALSSEELRHILSSDTLSESDHARNALNDIIMTTNRQCPIRVDVYTTLDSVGIESGYYTNYFSVIENSYTLSTELMRSILRTSLTEGADIGLTYHISLCVKGNYGICYQYSMKKETDSIDKQSRNTKKKNCMRIVFTIDDLKDILKEITGK